MRVPLAGTVAVGVICALAAAGLTYAVVRDDTDGSPPAHRAAAPVALTGVLRNSSGKPLVAAGLRLMAADSAAKVGEEFPIVGLASTLTDAAGRFTIRQPMSVSIIRKLAARNGGWVNFDVDINVGGHFMPWSVPRKIDGQRWLADEDTPAVLEPETITFKALR